MSGADEIDLLIAEVDRRRTFVLTALQAPGWIIIGGAIVTFAASRLGLPAVGACVAAIAGAASLLGLSAYRAVMALRVAEGKLVESGDLRVVGVLAEALETPSRQDRSALIGFLCKMLSTMREEDAGLLNSEHRETLARLLLHGEDVELSVAILRAYSAVGGIRELGLTRMLARGILAHTRDPRIAAAAEEALPPMEERVARWRETGTLLRGASDAGLLARPAVLAGSPSEHLVTPAGANEDVAASTLEALPVRPG